MLSNLEVPGINIAGFGRWNRERRSLDSATPGTSGSESSTPTTDPNLITPPISLPLRTPAPSPTTVTGDPLSATIAENRVVDERINAACASLSANVASTGVSGDGDVAAMNSATLGTSDPGPSNSGPSNPGPSNPGPSNPGRSTPYAPPSPYILATRFPPITPSPSPRTGAQDRAMNERINLADDNAAPNSVASTYFRANGEVVTLNSAALDGADRANDPLGPVSDFTLIRTPVLSTVAPGNSSGQIVDKTASSMLPAEGSSTEDRTSRPWVAPAAGPLSLPDRPSTCSGGGPCFLLGSSLARTSSGRRHHGPHELSAESFGNLVHEDGRVRTTNSTGTRSYRLSSTAGIVQQDGFGPNTDRDVVYTDRNCFNQPAAGNQIHPINENLSRPPNPQQITQRLTQVLAGNDGSNPSGDPYELEASALGTSDSMPAGDPKPTPPSEDMTVRSGNAAPSTREHPMPRQMNDVDRPAVAEADVGNPTSQVTPEQAQSNDQEHRTGNQEETGTGNQRPTRRLGLVGRLSSTFRWGNRRRSNNPSSNVNNPTTNNNHDVIEVDHDEDNSEPQPAPNIPAQTEQQSRMVRAVRGVKRRSQGMGESVGQGLENTKRKVQKVFRRNRPATPPTSDTSASAPHVTDPPPGTSMPTTAAAMQAHPPPVSSPFTPGAGMPRQSPRP